MRRIVVGFDGSNFAISAPSWAVDEARRHQAELVALAVRDEPPDPVPASTEQPPIGEVLDPLPDAVAANAPEYPATFRYAVGSPGAERVAAGRDADLLVLGSRGDNPLASLLLGSTSDYCGHHAACPVMVVRSGDPGAATP